MAIVPARYTGRLAGVIQMCSALAGILAPIVTGSIVDLTGSFTPAFVVAGAITLVGAGCTLVLVRDRAPLTEPARRSIGAGRLRGR